MYPGYGRHDARQAGPLMATTEEDAMFKTSLLCGAALIASVGLAAGAGTPESAIPNFSAAAFGWQPITFLDFEPIAGKVAPIGPDPTYSPGRGIERLSDAENPNLKPWAAAQMRMHNDLVRNGHRAFNAQSRCWPGGGPGQLLFVAEPVYFIQTPQEVWIIWQRNQQVRRVYLNREHSENPKPSWFGESIGRYENGKLVVNTVGFVEHPYSFLDNYRTPHTKDLHVVERWKIVDGGNALEAAVTVEDPGAFNAPWSGMARWQKVNRPMIESICAENNLSYETFFKLREYPMPEAKTPDF
jgi:hypothetical protein